MMSNIQKAISVNSSKNNFDKRGYPTNVLRDKFLAGIMVNGELPENVELLPDGGVRWVFSKFEGGVLTEYGLPK